MIRWQNRFTALVTYRVRNSIKEPGRTWVALRTRFRKAGPPMRLLGTLPREGFVRRAKEPFRPSPSS